MSADWEATQRRLLEVLAESERERHGGGHRRAQFDGEIAGLAAELGLDPADLEGLTTPQLAALAAPGSLQGRFRVMRRARDVMLFYVGLLLAPIVAGLGAREAAAGIAAVVVLAAVVHHRRRLSRFDIDGLGRLDVRHGGRIDWADVEAASFRLCYPWLAPYRGTGHAEGVTAEVRIRRTAGRELRLAQGQLFQIRPQRRPITLDKLGRYLRDQARAAGLAVTRLPDDQEGWTAKR